MMKCQVQIALNRKSRGNRERSRRCNRGRTSPKPLLHLYGKVAECRMIRKSEDLPDTNIAFCLRETNWVKLVRAKKQGAALRGHLFCSDEGLCCLYRALLPGHDRCLSLSMYRASLV